PEVGSRAAAERLLETGEVLVDGERRPKSHRLTGGETVELEPPEAPPELVPEEVPLRVAYEDEHLIVVDKPAGIVVHPSQGHATDTRRDAVTHFEVERLLDGHALLDVRLETGRTHQIRVHLAAIGLPVAGDPVYGAPDPQLGRQFLHAWRLAFTHPVTGEPLEVESPLPPELQAALERFAS